MERMSENVGSFDNRVISEIDLYRPQYHWSPNTAIELTMVQLCRRYY